MNVSPDTRIVVPAEGARIVAGERVPNNPIIPFIEGDGMALTSRR
jgi:isocitrate dehydrogenase